MNHNFQRFKILTLIKNLKTSFKKKKITKAFTKIIEICQQQQNRGVLVAPVES